MEMETCLLFCENPFQANRVDEDFNDQFLAAKQHGFEILTFSYEELIDPERVSTATKRIKAGGQLKKVIYRGWMLTPTQYSILYNDLMSKNFQLINSVEQYQNCHYLPDSLRFIEGRTPRTVFEKFENETSIEKLIDKAKVFGHAPVILKDYVKSEKHDWDSACYVRDASDEDELSRSIRTLINLRGRYLNEGIVIRAFVALNDLTIHSKSGMPLTEEYRLFFCNNQLIGMYDYWDEGEYSPSKPDTAEFEEIAKRIDSNFFSMDIARQKNGELIIIELGDGQVAGIPERADVAEFYQKLRNSL